MYKQTIELENDWFKDGDREAEGLHLLIIGGTHGNESNAVKMVSEFLRKLNPKNKESWWKNTYFNKLTVVNAINQTGLRYNKREFVQEEKVETNDLNRYFNTTKYPTKEGVMGELESIIKEADVDVVVDVHNTPNILPCISIALNKNAGTYIDWAIRSKTQFILTNDIPTIKRYADIDLGKIAFTYEFSGMGLDTRSNQLEYDVDTFEKFLTAIGKIWIFDKVFEREWYGIPKDLNTLKHTFYKKNNNPHLNYIPYLYEKKSFRLSTYADGIYKYPRGNPLGHYSKGEQIAFIENPVDQSIVGEARAPCDGTLIDVDDSWWACKDGILGDFQPDLEQNVFDYYKEENK